MVAEMITIHEARPTTSEVSSNVAHQDDELSDEMMKMLKEALDDFDEQQPMKAKTLAKQQSHHDEHHTISEETNLSHEQQMSPPKEAKASAAAIQPKCFRLATTTELDEEMRATAMPAESGPVRVDLQAVELWINHDRDGHSEDGTSTLNWGNGVLDLVRDKHVTILNAEQKEQQGLVYCRWQVPGRPPGKRMHPTTTCAIAIPMMAATLKTMREQPGEIKIAKSMWRRRAWRNVSVSFERSEGGVR